MASPSWYPGNSKYPSATLYPSARAPITSTLPSSSLFPSNFFYPATRQIRVTVKISYPQGGAGPPRLFLRPRVGLRPGSLLSHQVTYQRIHYPGAAVYPTDSLFPYFDGDRPAWELKGGVATLSGTSARFNALRVALYRQVTATLRGGGKWGVVGVLSSVPVDNILGTVYLSGGATRVDLASSTERVDLAAFPRKVEVE